MAKVPKLCIGVFGILMVLLLCETAPTAISGNPSTEQPAAIKNGKSMEATQVTNTNLIDDQQLNNDLIITKPPVLQKSKKYPKNRNAKKMKDKSNKYSTAATISGIDDESATTVNYHQQIELVKFGITRNLTWGDQSTTTIPSLTSAPTNVATTQMANSSATKSDMVLPMITALPFTTPSLPLSPQTEQPKDRLDTKGIRKILETNTMSTTVRDGERSLTDTISNIQTNTPDSTKASGIAITTEHPENTTTSMPSFQNNHNSENSTDPPERAIPNASSSVILLGKATIAVFIPKNKTTGIINGNKSESAAIVGVNEKVDYTVGNRKWMSSTTIPKNDEEIIEPETTPENVMTSSLRPNTDLPTIFVSVSSSPASFSTTEDNPPAKLLSMLPIETSMNNTIATIATTTTTTTTTNTIKKIVKFSDVEKIIDGKPKTTEQPTSIKPTTTTNQNIEINLSGSTSNEFDVPGAAAADVLAATTAGAAAAAYDDDGSIIVSSKKQFPDEYIGGAVNITNSSSNNNNNNNITRGAAALMGHDGVKITKKKQLLEEHFKDDDDFITKSYTNLNDENIPITNHNNNHKNNGNDFGGVNGNKNTADDHQIGNSTTENPNEYTKLDSATTTIITNITGFLPETIKNTTNSVETITQTETNIELSTTLVLDIDLLVSRLPESYVEIFPQEPHEIYNNTNRVNISLGNDSEFIKHKNFEKSLISKMEWIPIESVQQHNNNNNNITETSYINNYENNKDVVIQLTTTTIIPDQRTTTEMSAQTKLMSTVQQTEEPNDSEQKSLEIEIIDGPFFSTTENKMKINTKSVPEFFEIESSKQKETIEKEADSSAIEIQINVSEGFGNESENLEFSFRQPDTQKFKETLHSAHHPPPPGFQEIGEITIQRSPDLITLKPIAIPEDRKPIKPNETDEILQVEITAIDNSTVNGGASIQRTSTTTDEKHFNNGFNENPKFTVHSEPNLDLQENDDFFVPDLKVEGIDDSSSGGGKTIDSSGRESIDRDSDTIFYISNTEVKVVEALPTANNLTTSHETTNDNENNRQLDSNRSKLEAQFFPTIYDEDVLIDLPANLQQKSASSNRNGKLENQQQGQRYPSEDDIILSPLKNNFDPLKTHNEDEIILNSSEKEYSGVSDLVAARQRTLAAAGALRPPQPPPADVSYVGETFIEIEESTNSPSQPADNYNNQPAANRIHSTKTTTSTKKDTDSMIGGGGIDDVNDDSVVDMSVVSGGALLSDVIIQPAVIPEMSIGVPVIGELPPQIELKEIDYLPGGRNGRIDGGSIQYGGDLIADDVELNVNPNRYIFESGYPYGDEKISRSSMSRSGGSESLDDDGGSNGNADDDVMVTSQQIVMHAVNNLQREQFIADLPSGSWEQFKDLPIKRSNTNDSNKSLNVELVTASQGYTTATNSTTNSQLLNTTYLMTNSTGGNSTELLGNATAYSVLEETDSTEFSFTDMQTLLIACFATLVPLILSLLLAFGLRYLWRKYRQDPDEGSGLVGDSSTDPLAVKSTAISQDELQTTESGYTLNRSNDTLESNTDLTGGIIDNYGGRCGGGTVGLSNGGGGVGCHNNYASSDGSTNILKYDEGCGDVGANAAATYNGTMPTGLIKNHGGGGGGGCEINGSVTTMTLKNNHLIVETEERNDISRDARETKMHYTSSEKDGVFVVEVARGADSTGMPSGSPHKELLANNHPKSCSIDMNGIEQKKKMSTQNDDYGHEEVQIHQPPRSDDRDALIEVEEPAESPQSQRYQAYNLGNSNTGLSQSDLSSSSDDSNKAYNYGKQELYTIQTNGYSPPSPQPKLDTPVTPSLASPLPSPTPTPKPKPPAPAAEPEQRTEKRKICENGLNERIIPLKDACTAKLKEVAEADAKLKLEAKLNNINNTTSNHQNTETKPIITAALLKQDTINEICNIVEPLSVTAANVAAAAAAAAAAASGKSAIFNHRENGNDYCIEDEIVAAAKINGIEMPSSQTYGKNKFPMPTPVLSDDIIVDGEVNLFASRNIEINLSVEGDKKIDTQQQIHVNGSATTFDTDANADEDDCEVGSITMIGNCITSNGENGFDSIISLPEPPSTEEIKQMNDIISMENAQLDSLPPPPPPISQGGHEQQQHHGQEPKSLDQQFSFKNIDDDDDDDNRDPIIQIETDNNNHQDDGKTILALSSAANGEHVVGSDGGNNGIGSGGGGNGIIPPGVAVTGSS